MSTNPPDIPDPQAASHPGPSPEPAPSPAQVPGHDAAAATQAILGRRILTSLAIVSFVLAVTLLGVVTFRGSLINTPISRMCLIALVSLSLTTFAWVFYPLAVQAQRVNIPFLNWQVTGFGGPLLLFVLTLGVLHLFFPPVQNPSLPATRFYALDDPRGPTPSATFRFNGRKTHPRLLPVMDSTAVGDGLAGFVAVFDSPEPFSVELSSAEGFFPKQTVQFESGISNGRVTLASPD